MLERQDVNNACYEHVFFFFFFWGGGGGGGGHWTIHDVFNASRTVHYLRDIENGQKTPEIARHNVLGRWVLHYLAPMLYLVSFFLVPCISHLLSKQSFHLHIWIFYSVYFFSSLFRSQNHDNRTLHKTCFNHYHNQNFAFSVLQSFFLLGPLITFIPYQTRFISLLSKKYFLFFFFRLSNNTNYEWKIKPKTNS